MCVCVCVCVCVCAHPEKKKGCEDESQVGGCRAAVIANAAGIELCVCVSVCVCVLQFQEMNISPHKHILFPSIYKREVFQCESRTSPSSVDK